MMEVRNKKWLDEKFYELLKENKVAFTLLDHAGNFIYVDINKLIWCDP